VTQHYSKNNFSDKVQIFMDVSLTIHSRHEFSTCQLIGKSTCPSCALITMVRIVDSLSIASFTLSWVIWSQWYNRTHFRWSMSQIVRRYNFCCKAIYTENSTRLSSRLLGAQFSSSITSSTSGFLLNIINEIPWLSLTVFGIIPWPNWGATTSFT